MVFLRDFPFFSCSDSGFTIVRGSLGGALGHQHGLHFARNRQMGLVSSGLQNELKDSLLLPCTTKSVYRSCHSLVFADICKNGHASRLLLLTPATQLFIFLPLLSSAAFYHLSFLCCCGSNGHATLRRYCSRLSRHRKNDPARGDNTEERVFLLLPPTIPCRSRRLVQNFVMPCCVDSVRDGRSSTF